MRDINLIWAEGLNHAIGVNNSLPWHLPEDLKRFKELTTGQTVVMGRKTWESLPENAKPLPNRTNIVLTRSPDALTSVEGLLTYSSVEKLLYDRPEDLWVIGGSEVYKAFMPVATHIYYTGVDIEVPDADAWAPEIPDEFQPIEVDPLSHSENGLGYRFVTYVKDPNYYN